GIAERHIIATMPPWVEYELTPRGHELARTLDKIKEWGRRNLASDEVLTAVLTGSYTAPQSAVVAID
ncbi:MAG: transcriptional regulator, partial [Dehalococcoidia bacterium]|nr:transcriptional regulator [Dehalococcoidia bacterium]